jgi:hypothetical protein
LGRSPSADGDAAVTVDEFLGRLERVKRKGTGWVARCPAHEDRNPSLSVGEGADRRILLCCHAGCTVDAIVAAAGLEMRDLFPDGHRLGRRLPPHPVRRADFSGTALDVANVLYALERLGDPWRLMLTSDCPYCGAQGAWLRASSTGGVDADCPDGCNVERYIGALRGRIHELKGTTQ